MNSAHCVHNSMRETMAKRLKKKYYIAGRQPNPHRVSPRQPLTMMNHPVHPPQTCCGGRVKVELDTPTMAPVVPKKFRRWDCFSAMNIEKLAHT